MFDWKKESEIHGKSRAALRLSQAVVENEEFIKHNIL